METHQPNSLRFKTKQQSKPKVAFKQTEANMAKADELLKAGILKEISNAE